MERIRRAFATCRAEKRPALVTYVTAGYPSKEATLDVLLGVQRGGADVIELGLAFTDPIADGPTISAASTKALANGITVKKTLGIAKDARAQGLNVPLLCMSYYNPILKYGEEALCHDAREAGIDGFIVVDLPPEEALKFRGYCTKFGLSFVPLIAPSTSEARMKFLCQMADSFIYVVSRMGVTGANGTLNADLPKLLERVRTCSGGVPAAVGFGVSIREHFLNVASIAEGVVIGSQIITELSKAAPGEEGSTVERYCREIVGKESVSKEQTREIGIVEAVADAMEPKGSPTQANKVITESYTNGSTNGLVDQLEALNTGVVNSDAVPMRFGEFGGQYVPESLMDCLKELDEEFQSAVHDPSFWGEFRSYYPYMGRPSQLQSHKINNAIGQILIARRAGKTSIIAETGAGQHGVATATVCAKFGMECTVYMGSEDVRRQALNVFRMKLLGAKVVAVDAGSRTLRDAVNEALRAWVVNLKTTHYVLGSAIGPHPFPTIVRTFQCVIGNETKEQMHRLHGKLPDAVVACVGGGSNAVGMFYPFSKDPSVKLLGVEAGGDGLDSTRHAATLSGGTIGVLHGVKTYVLQDEHGQVSDTHSVSAGLDYPAVGPELASWKDSNRAEFIVATDQQAFHGFKMLSELEGIIPALETAHAIWGAVERARQMPKDKDIVICLSGRGDKDVQSVADELPRFGPQIGWNLRF